MPARKTCICAVHKLTTVSRTGINAVLYLQTPGRYNDAGIGDVRLIRVNLVLDAWTIVRLRGGRAVVDKQRQQDCLRVF